MLTELFTGSSYSTDGHDLTDAPPICACQIRARGRKFPNARYYTQSFYPKLEFNGGTRPGEYEQITTNWKNKGGEWGWWRVALSNDEEGRSTKDREKINIYKML